MLDGLSEQPVRYSPDVRDLRQGSISELVLGFVNTLLATLYCKYSPESCRRPLRPIGQLSAHLAHF
ncbi:hypothetical protein COMA1_11109 [Candidatus Nitrospira nitrosa]|uniref:Uncharacterized protein n=1 Tax=Candidatus Nitrospira nitrosa TaxID=1742972 RepID=A0A0S4L9A4_9BACT|nr:hypothetical protein COMA1_11109 [Candidatus Nitrospira nitrosa]